MKIGLYFGSFNPVHQGHMILANYILAHADLDELWFIVSPHNPLKDKKSLLHEHDRLKMVEIAIGSVNFFKVSDIEFNLPQPSYTIDTLIRLSERHPSHEFAIICGTDALESFHKWKNFEQILDHYTLLVYPRKDASGGSLVHHPHVQLVQAPQIELSSSFIRNAIKNGLDIRFMLPTGVFEYILQKKFYC
jgi:nicotinate-nucleotide adenylyltransferase